ncbi:helix-turn-helix domain-containing protein [Kitasatospora viridis]|nr:helix-turn-helix domain-containing protein [Kitasatospora viridis]
MAMAVDPTLSVGQRIKHFRKRAGKSRAALAGSVGRSEGWLKAVENGRLLLPSLPTLVKIAEHLGIADPGALIGDLSLPTAMFSGAEHAALSVVRRVIDTAPLGLSAGPAPDVRQVADQVTAGWTARNSRGDHRTALGELLPSLVPVASVAASHPECADRRQAEVLYASTLNLVQMFAAYQGDGNLVWRVAERSLATARASGDLAAIGQSCWFLVEAFRQSGQWDSAQALAEEAMRLLDPVRTESPQLAAAWADMAFHAAITHARAGEAGSAWGWFDRAERAARMLPGGFWQSATSGSVRVIPVHAVTVAVELRQVGTALRWAGRVAPDDIPSRPRRARHLIEVSRAFALRGEPEAVASTLSDAALAAGETVRWNREAHELVRGLLSGPASVQPVARRLATVTGLAA